VGGHDRGFASMDFGGGVGVLGMAGGVRGRSGMAEGNIASGRGIIARQSYQGANIGAEVGEFWSLIGRYPRIAAPFLFKAGKLDFTHHS